MLLICHNLMLFNIRMANNKEKYNYIQKIYVYQKVFFFFQSFFQCCTHNQLTSDIYIFLTFKSHKLRFNIIYF